MGIKSDKLRTELVLALAPRNGLWRLKLTLTKLHYNETSRQ